MCKKLWQKLFPPTLVLPPQAKKWDKGEEKQSQPQQSTPAPDIKPIQAEIKSADKSANKGRGQGQGKGKGNFKKQ